jgi:hypothetical protein
MIKKIIKINLFLVLLMGTQNPTQAAVKCSALIVDCIYSKITDDPYDQWKDPVPDTLGAKETLTSEDVKNINALYGTLVSTQDKTTAKKKLQKVVDEKGYVGVNRKVHGFKCTDINALTNNACSLFGNTGYRQYVYQTDRQLGGNDGNTFVISTEYRLSTVLINGGRIEISGSPTDTSKKNKDELQAQATRSNTTIQDARNKLATAMTKAQQNILANKAAQKAAEEKAKAEAEAAKAAQKAAQEKAKAEAEAAKAAQKAAQDKAQAEAQALAKAKAPCGDATVTCYVLNQNAKTKEIDPITKQISGSIKPIFNGDKLVTDCAHLNYQLTADQMCKADSPNAPDQTYAQSYTLFLNGTPLTNERFPEPSYITAMKALAPANNCPFFKIICKNNNVYDRQQLKNYGGCETLTSMANNVCGGPGTAKQATIESIASNGSVTMGQTYTLNS